MAKDFWDKFKISSDVIKDNKWLVLILFTGLSSMATNAGQFISSLNQQADNEKAIHEVAAGFQAMIEIKPEVVKSTCLSCDAYINQHLRTEH